MGCLQPWLPRLIWALTALIVGVVVWGSVENPEAMWAPGHLNRSHTDITECQACHEPFRGATARKCLACHTDREFQVSAEFEVNRQHQKIIRQAQPCSDCHMEHQGALAPITVRMLTNPHGEFIFRATGTNACSDCHRVDPVKGTVTPGLLENSRVQHLLAEGDGIHQPGRFAKCLNCHRGGQLEIEDD